MAGWEPCDGDRILLSDWPPHRCLKTALYGGISHLLFMQKGVCEEFGGADSVTPRKEWKVAVFEGKGRQDSGCTKGDGLTDCPAAVALM